VGKKSSVAGVCGELLFFSINWSEKEQRKEIRNNEYISLGEWEKIVSLPLEK
jgi:hypothetical protein